MKWPKPNELVQSVLNAYGQIFFSDHRLFGLILLLTTFFFPLAGFAGLLSVLLTSLLAFYMGFDRRKTVKGLWGYNALLATLPLGLFYEPGLAFWVLVVVVSLFTFLLTIAVQGILAKYQLPFLSLPFVLIIWILVLATREFEALQFNGQNIYQLNELYGIGGTWLVGVYEWFQNLRVGAFVKAYLISLSAIFFQNSIAGGIFIAFGLLLASRISFILSIIGFSAAYGFYLLMGMGITEADYAYIGFNYMLTAIAVGGFYNIPTKTSILWVILLTPIVAIITIGFSELLANWQLSVYALPFNITTILFIYVMKWRFEKGKNLQEVQIQQNSPEKNLYAFVNYNTRFEEHRPFLLSLPFWGDWFVSQGYDGEITHRGDWRHAWDFVMIGEDGNTYRNEGTKLSDFLAYDKPVLSPADGYIVEGVEGIPDNLVGQVNLKNNWGNTVIIKHDEQLYAKLSHFKKGSIKVRKGDWVTRGTQLGTCGNSGRSPEPHIHFQMQATPYIESSTLEYPISYYLKKDHGGYESKAFSIPKQTESIRNPEPMQLLHKLFDFVPGQRLKLNFVLNNEERNVVWEIKTTPFNESYIVCQDSGSKAFYQMNGQVFYFVHFEGNRKSPLYFFYLAFFQVPLYYGKQTKVADQFPPNQVFSKVSMIFQDFLAPFAIYLVGKYSLNLPEKKDLFGNDEVHLNSDVRLCIFDQIIQSWKFSMNLSEEGIEVDGQSESSKIQLKWERNL
ncbi:MAG: peptidoglycan DD-metalloendopeptidase family protein [Bacteroidetes bacterium]|nr:peptidoglycan DD-metalloendopeptidase family protein [Bacteroidota bacterium]